MPRVARQRQRSSSVSTAVQSLLMRKPRASTVTVAKECGISHNLADVTLRRLRAAGLVTGVTEWCHQCRCRHTHWSLS